MADNKVVDRARQVLSDAVEGTRDVIDDGIDEARDRFEGAAEDLERNARRAQREVRRRAQRLGSAAREKYDAAAEGVRAGYQRVRHDAAQVTDNVNVYVRENPGKSILIAAGVGFIIGLLVRGGIDPLTRNLAWDDALGYPGCLYVHDCTTLTLAPRREVLRRAFKMAPSGPRAARTP